MARRYRFGIEFRLGWQPQGLPLGWLEVVHLAQTPLIYERPSHGRVDTVSTYQKIVLDFTPGSRRDMFVLQVDTVASLPETYLTLPILPVHILQKTSHSFRKIAPAYDSRPAKCGAGADRLDLLSQSGHRIERMEETRTESNSEGINIAALPRTL